jgi:hypothetical protein
MSNPPNKTNPAKARVGGARKFPDPLSMATLITFAEKVIRTDKEAALRAQNSVADMGSASNDVRSTPRVGYLQELCCQAGAVKIIDDDNSSNNDGGEKDEGQKESDKFIAFDPFRRQT